MQLIHGFRRKFKFYETRTYSGAPAMASATIGAQMMDRLAGAAAEALGEVLRGELPPDQWHSPVWKVRWLFTSEFVKWAFERWVGHRSPVW